jgi:hypothetical protein
MSKIGKLLESNIITYMVTGFGDIERFRDVDTLIKFMEKKGHSKSGISNKTPNSAPWLEGQPTFKDMAGPFADGNNVVRYDTWEMYNLLMS